MIRQLSVFVENKPGSFHTVTDILSRESIKLFAFCSVDSPEFGILRLIVDRPEDAEKVLTGNGFMVKNYDVTAVRTKDTQELNSLMNACTESNISINYMYSAAADSEGNQVVILHTEYPDETESMLKGKQFDCLNRI